VGANIFQENIFLMPLGFWPIEIAGFLENGIIPVINGK
jgi:hypothetical protein